MAFTACQKEAQDPIQGTEASSEETQLVTLDLEGDLSDPLDEFARALQLEPGTAAGSTSLTPKFTDGEEVDALCGITSADGTKGSPILRAIKLKVSEGGKKLSYKGDILASNDVGGEIRLSVFIGFNGSNSNKPLKYPDTAPYLAQTGPRTPITDFPIALQAKVDITATAGTNDKSFKSESLKFRLIGSLIRCKLVNETDEVLSLKGLELHGLGAQDLRLVKTKSNSKEYFAASGKTAPKTSSRNYMFSAPLTLQPGADAGYYIVYAPLVSKQDGLDTDYEGYILPIFESEAIQKKYLLDRTPKVLPEAMAGKIAQKTIKIQKHTNPIHENSIPLQYWNYRVAYKDANGLQAILAPSSRQPIVHGFETKPFFSNNRLDKQGIFFRPSEVTHEQIKNADFKDNSGNSLNLHIPTAEEIAGILPPDLISTNNYPVYYQSTAAYSGKKVETIEVAGKRLAGTGTYWRGAVGGTMSQDLLNILLGQGDLGVQKPIYALRFGKPTAAEIADYKAKGGDESLLVKDNKSRVAYMYIFMRDHIRIHSCYIGENNDIQTAQDLETKNVFRTPIPSQLGYNGSEDKGSYNGNSIILRWFRTQTPIYTTPGALFIDKFAKVSRAQMPHGKLLEEAYPGSSIPAAYYNKAGLLMPPTGYLCRKSSTDNTIEGHWLTRTRENYGPGEIVYSYMYHKDANNKAYIKDLQQDATHYFSFPLYLFSKEPRGSVINNPDLQYNYLH